MLLHQVFQSTEWKKKSQIVDDAGSHLGILSVQRGVLLVVGSSSAD